jgi:hypothetical protein
MIATFWCAHARARSYGLHQHHLHPRHLLTLWKQLILSTTDTYLPFIQKDTHLTRFGAAINASLGSLFTPQVRNANCLYRALKAELGIPSTRTLADMAVVHLHAHIAALSPQSTARTLYNIYIQDQSKFTSNFTIPSRARDTLSKVDSEREWFTLSLDIPENNNLRGELTQRTKKKMWLMKKFHSLHDIERQQLDKWATKNPGRAQQYIEITRPDHEHSLHTRSLAKTPFWPSIYLHRIESHTTALNLLHLRAQMSLLPALLQAAHIPTPHKYQHKHSTNFSRTPYLNRYCTLCLPPQHTWGLLAPDPSHPIGDEPHIFLTCPVLTRDRDNIFGDLNTILSYMRPAGLDPLLP